MMARIHKAMDEREQGFTLIELLVVMIIIGILAAIAIPLFLTQREKAQDSAAKADVSTLGKEIATYYVDGTGTPSVSINAAGEWEITDGTDTWTVGNASDNVVLKTNVAAAATATTWCVAVTNAEGDKTVAPNGASYSATGGLQVGADVDC